MSFHNEILIALVEFYFIREFDTEKYLDKYLALGSDNISIAEIGCYLPSVSV